MKRIIGLIILIAWMFGIVLAKGFWSTLVSIIFFPWGLYLTVEHFAWFFGLI
jgi:hypothetical protein